ncbi:MAG: DUF6596 domain-containing protein [Thermomicrobiales bacterium]
MLQVIYLVYNEGYTASGGESLTRSDLSNEAIRLTRLLYQLLPEPDVAGLLALMLLQESRHDARETENGDIILLDDQDRARWNRTYIEEGSQLVSIALANGEVGVYTIQAAIAAIHAAAPTPQQTNWNEIVAFYDLLIEAQRSPVVELNRAVAIAMRDGPEQGLTLIDDILERGDLASYHLAHAARADLLRRLDRPGEARVAYVRALEFVALEPERTFPGTPPRVVVGLAARCRFRDPEFDYGDDDAAPREERRCNLPHHSCSAGKRRPVCRCPNRSCTRSPVANGPL